MSTLKNGQETNVKKMCPTPFGGGSSSFAWKIVARELGLARDPAGIVS
jgi:hypothetical protein